jgi:outer membrane protein assembly factor BamE (lipoprotein component of BamABCDE complex)
MGNIYVFRTASRAFWFGFRAAGVLMAIVLTACAAGTNFSQEEVDRLQPGTTTYDQAVSVLGKPYAVRSDANGRKLATWSYANVGSTRAVGIVFDSRGVMERVASRTDSSGTKPGP